MLNKQCVAGFGKLRVVIIALVTKPRILGQMRSNKENSCNTNQEHREDDSSSNAHSRLTNKAQPRWSNDLARVSGTDNANRRWLQRLVRRRSMRHRRSKA